MSRRDPGVLLADLRMAVEKIERYCTGMDRAAFLADEKTADAVVRNLEIIGEATKQMPCEFQERILQSLGVRWPASGTESFTTTLAST